jgi:N-acetylglucosamine-6-phosphate deacetylase
LLSICCELLPSEAVKETEEPPQIVVAVAETVGLFRLTMTANLVVLSQALTV